ncbi:uncharacterized protein LOC144111271 [Amblyomma americanum]
MDHDYSALPVDVETSDGANDPWEVLVTNEQGDSSSQVDSMEVVQSSTCNTSHMRDKHEQELHLALRDVTPTSEEDILGKHLLDLKKEGIIWTGYAPSREAFVGLQLDLAAINVSFQTVCSSSPKGRLLFSSQRGYVVVKEDVPFKVVQNILKGCLFGRELKKVQESRSEQERGPDSSATHFEQKVVKRHKTKKKGCTAVMHVKHVEAYPQFKLNLSENCTKAERENASREALSQLKVALQEEASGKPVVRQHRFYIRMSDAESHHNHDIGADCAGSSLLVNPDVAKKIAQLVQEGVTSVKAIESYLKIYVRDVLFANKECPSSTRTDFYPTRVNIKNHVQRALRKYRSSSADHENVAAYVELLQDKAPATNCFFHVYQVETTEAHSPEQDKQQVVSGDSDVLKNGLHASYRDGLCLAAHDTERETLSEMEEDCDKLAENAAVSEMEDCEQLAENAAASEMENCEHHVAEDHASDLLKASQQTTHNIKSQIRAKVTQVLSSLCHVHDHTVLQQLLFLFTEASNLAQANVATSSGTDIRGSPAKGSSGIKHKKGTQASAAGMKMICL